MPDPGHPPPPAASAEITPHHPRLRVALAFTIAILLIAGLLGVGRTRRRDLPHDTTLAGQVARLERETARVRELDFRSVVTPTFLSPSELADEIRAQARATDVGTGLPDQTVLQLLGLIPEGDDLREQLIEATASSVIGFYDPDTKRLVVQRGHAGLFGPLAQTTLVHELTHAVTDQHHDLGSTVTGHEPDDEQAARVALVEGDATLSMTLWASTHLSFAQQLNMSLEAAGGLTSAPDISPQLGEILAFPYIQGLAFAQALHASGGWAAVDRAYADPPITTEQILHPERYLTRDPPGTPVDAPLRAGTAVTARGQIGELFLREMLQVVPAGFAGRIDAAAVAAGWDGGDYVLSSGQAAGDVLQMAFHWDTSRDVDEFTRSIVVWAQEKWGIARIRTSNSGGTTYLLGNDRCLDVNRPSTLDAGFTLYSVGC